MIDFNKPVQTRGGQAVRILCTDRAHRDNKVVGLVDTINGQQEPLVWTLSGAYIQCGGPHPLDLINVPERVERWVPMFCQEAHGSLTSIRDSRETAIAACCNAFPLLKLLRITYEDGKPVAVALEDCK